MDPGGAHPPRAGDEPTRAPGAPAQPAQPLAQPVRIGPYRIISVLGEGGFGVVYLAERRDPHVQRVALKVIKPGMDSRAVVARFEQERQALAFMDHPCVARVFDGGVTPDGRPYFVMELVKGEPITDYCDRQSLSVRDRLRLFVPVCEAVQHAHSKGVIHRDLKPSNVLVEIIDGRPMPKVIDFGVAKAISHTSESSALFTEIGVIIGTPEYMSPEQAEMGRADIDTRTDVYSLGVLLYELLTGALPFDSRSLRAAGYAEIQRIIREVDPPRPSTRLTSMADAAGDTVARRRAVRFEELARELRRELEWIPLKAMRKDRTQRYRTPIELADDISNYLAGRPLIAGPESALYRLRKFARRRRALLAAVAAVFLALIAGLAVAAWGLVRAIDARDQARASETEAQRQARIASASVGFLVSTLERADPSVSGPDPRVADVLDRAAPDIESSFPGEPDVRASLHDAYGRVYQALGRHTDSGRHFADAVRAARAAGAGDQAAQVSSLLALAGARFDEGRDPDAEAALAEALAAAGAAEAPPAWKAPIARLLGVIAHNAGDYATAERRYREALEAERALDPSGIGVADCQDLLSRLLIDAGRPIEAEPRLADALERKRALTRPDSNSISFTILTRAYLESARGDAPRALASAREALAMRRSLFPGDDNPNVQLARMVLAGLAEDFPAHATPDDRAVAAAFDPASLGVLAWVDAVNLRNRARVLCALGRAPEGFPLFERSAAAARSIGADAGAVHEAHTRESWAAALLASGDASGADAQRRRALAVIESRFGEQHPRAADARKRLAPQP